MDAHLQLVSHDRPLDLTPYTSLVRKISDGVTAGVIRVLFTDIDGTLQVGASHTPEQIAQGKHDSRACVQYSNEQNVILIGLTGSHFAADHGQLKSIESRISQGELPSVGTRVDNFYMDAWVTDGGSRSRYAAGDRLTLDGEYQKKVEKDPFDYQCTFTRVESLIDSLNAGLQNEFTELKHATIKAYDPSYQEKRCLFQAGTINGDHRANGKIAAYFYANTIEERDNIEFRFRKEFPAAKIVCCEEIEVATTARRMYQSFAGAPVPPLKYCIDITTYDKSTPVSIFADSIRAEARRYAARLGKPMPRIEIGVAGDSGNDLAPMRDPNVTFVIIAGGSSAELLREAHNLLSTGRQVYAKDSALGPASVLSALKRHTSSESWSIKLPAHW